MNHLSALWIVLRKENISVLFLLNFLEHITRVLYESTESR
jgi:hypothetical protein